MRRACLNRLDSTLDLLWFKPSDACGSFTSFSLYGRDDQLKVFQFMGSYSSYSIDNLSIKLSNLKDWEFYLVYNKDCNGVDSLFSDTIIIDNQEPIMPELDSVSVDPITQKTIVGWAVSGSKDVKGYNIYYVTGTNSVINTTSGTTYIDNGPRDPTAGPLKYSIAAFDSCVYNISLIDTPHQTIFLKSTYNQCNKTISIDWTPYVGWPVKSYEIFRKINAGNFQLIASVAPQINQFTYNFPVFGDVYCFYVRAIKASANKVSSSSNIVCVNTNSIIATQRSYIAKASVQLTSVDLTLVTQGGTSLQKLNIYKAEGNGAFSLWQTINHTGGVLELKDVAVNVQTKSYSYYFTTEGPCNLIFDTSQIAKTILLSVIMKSPGDQELNWNLYSDFIKFTQNQELLLSNSNLFTRSSTWNILGSLNTTTNSATDNTLFGLNQEKICYCIRAVENPPTGTYSRQDTSYSNIQCVTADPIIYFPNAIQINGYNTVFYPQGVFVDSTLSHFEIYNRWGEIIFETNNIFKGWDGTENNEFVQSDVYAYRATIIGINGKVLYFDGTITVLK
jgi:gliding motility-associated-like protein